ncbi:RNA polymerase sigma-70 factor [Parabacteroides timonensis]|uniref:RNA polymerase sigma-70 factor n=1 Tax=Parabacteroides timonensis TaxID=1871013 RepID=UPI001F20763D|nr:RNA polymerase sigma-70 factor [Parabacteroides timonensis]
MMKNGTNTEDGLLLKALGLGDMKAFDVIFNKYFPKMKRFLCGFLDSEEEAEDLSQDIFVKLWQNRTVLKDVDNLNAYLYRVAKNTVYSYFERTLKIETSIDLLSDTPTTESLEEILFANELEELIDLTVEQMPTQRKAIFIMSRKEGVKNHEIADRLNISVRTVETHISAALNDIRKVLSLLLLFF